MLDICCPACGCGFDWRTQQQLKMLRRMADLGMALAEGVAEFPLRTKHIDVDVTQNYELLTRGARRCMALEAKLADDARKRHQREVHGALAPTAPRERDEADERPAKKLPLVTTEDEESVIGPEPVVTDRPEDLKRDMREKLLDRFVDDRTPAVVVATVCRDLKIEEDVSVFLEPVPTRDDPWVRAEVEAAEVPEIEVARRTAPRAGPDAAERPAHRPSPPVTKVRDPP